MRRNILLLLALAIPAPAQETLFRQVFDTKTDTHVEVTSLFSHTSLGGYLPVRIQISNNQEISHGIYLSFKDSGARSGGFTSSSSFAFTAAPGKSYVEDILIPLSAQNGYSPYSHLEVALSGSMGEASGSTTSVFEPLQPAVLLSESLYTPNGSALDTERNSRSGTSGSYTGSGTGFASKFDPRLLPEDWRAFSGFDSIMLTETDWKVTSPGSRNAILSWLGLGGQLVVFYQNPPTLASIGIPADQGFGKALIMPVATDLRLDPKQTVDLSIPSSPAETRLQAVTSDFATSWPIQDEFGEKEFNQTFFIIILIAFGILVGPVNLFVFAKSGQRHRLFITTPLISITTSLLLVGLIILQDGIGGAGSRIVLMEVRPDENRNTSFIHQEQFSRTGVMTSPGFTLDAPALIVPIPIRTSRWARFTGDNGSRGTYNIQPAGGKLRATGDWFQSRSEQGQLISAAVPTRGRIEATANPGVMASTFSFPIETLFYLNSEGNWLRADKITKGGTAELQPVDPGIVLPILNKLASRFSTRNRIFLNQAITRKGHYIAISPEAPAIDTHPGIEWKTTTVITGPIVR